MALNLLNKKSLFFKVLYRNIFTCKVSLILLLFFCIFSTLVFASKDERNLKIAEFSIGSSAQSSNEYIKIYNDSDSAIDLNSLPISGASLRLRRRTSSGATDSAMTLTLCPKKVRQNWIVPARGYFLLASSGTGGFWPNSCQSGICLGSDVVPDATFSAAIVSGNSIYISSSASIAGTLDLVRINANTDVSAAAFDSNPIIFNGDANFVALERKAFSTSTALLMQSGEHSNLGNAYDSNTSNDDFLLQVSSNTQNSFSLAEPLLPQTFVFPNTNHLVISEVQISPSSQQFVELYNPTSSDISLNGYTLVRKTASGISSAVLATFLSHHSVVAHGYFLAAVKDYAEVFSDIFIESFSSSSDASLQLINASGQIVDLLGFGSISNTVDGYETSSYPVRPGSGKSLERKARQDASVESMQTDPDIIFGNAQDSNNNAQDFILSDNPQAQNRFSVVEPSSNKKMNAISDLRASAGNNEGEIILQWSLPSGVSGDVLFQYALRLSTQNVIISTQFANNYLSSDYEPSFSWNASASQQTLSNLLAGKTYFFALKSRAQGGEFSVWNSSFDALVNTQASAKATDFAPGPPQNFTVVSSNTALDFFWTASTSSDIQNYELSYSSYADFSFVQTMQYSSNTFSSRVNNLLNGVTIYAALRARDQEPSLYSSSVTMFAVPNMRNAQNLSVVHFDSAVVVSWKASLDESAANFAFYELYRAQVPGLYQTRIGTFSAALRQVTDTQDLPKAATFYYSLRTISYSNFAGDLPLIPTNFSEPAIAYPDTQSPAIFFTPIQFFNASRGELRLNINAQDYRDSAYTQTGKVFGAQLFYRLENQQFFQQTDFICNGSSNSFSRDCYVILPSTLMQFAAQNALTLNYFFTAQDLVLLTTSPLYTTTILSAPQKRIDSSGGNISLNFSSAAAAQIIVPSGALNLSKEISINVFDDANPAPRALLEGNINRALTDGGAPLIAYNFQPDGTVFNFPITARLYYPPTSIDKTKLKVFLREANQWVYQGGQTQGENTIVFYPTHFSIYAVFPVQENSLQSGDKQFLTPNGDGKNDEIIWPQNAANATIYDVTGRKICELRQDAAGSLRWRGQDSNGVTLPGGAYIAQVQQTDGACFYEAVIIVK